MSLKIEGANSEVTKKIKGSEAKLLAKGKAKMPNAKEFKVKMRPNLVKASSGTFYGGHLYGTEDGTKWMKCAEVRIREGKGGEAPKPAAAKPASKPAETEAPKLTKEDIQRRKAAEKRNLIEKKTKESVFGLARSLESKKDSVLSAYGAGKIFATREPKVLRTLFKPAVVKSLKIEASVNSGLTGGATASYRIGATLHLPFAVPDAEKIMKEHKIYADTLCREGFFHVFYEQMFNIANALEKGSTGLSKKNVRVREEPSGLHNPLSSKLSGNGVDVFFVAHSSAKILAWG